MMRPQSTLAAIAIEEMGQPQTIGHRLFAKRQREKSLKLLLSAELIQFKTHSTIFTWYWILWSSGKLMFNCIYNRMCILIC